MNCQELSSTEFDILVLANLEAHSHSGGTGEASGSAGQIIPTPVSLGNRGNVKRRVSIIYYFRGERVCKATFTFVHAIGPKRYKNLVSHFQQHGLTPRIHGNYKRLPANTIPMEKLRLSLLSLSISPRFMPFLYLVDCLANSAMTKPCYSHHKCPKDMCTDSTAMLLMKWGMFLCRRKIEDLWSQLRPHITSMKPATDLCDICQSNIVKIICSINLPESQKSVNLKVAEKHLELAKQEREYYNEQCILAARDLKLNPQSPKVIHCSFDFAQQIHFPASPQQVGPLYFLTPRKCQIFGICSEVNAVQVNYLIDENDSPGKGANCVISLVHHYLESKTSTGQHRSLHADNAVGQNKNNAAMHYLEWRVLSGRNPTIEISFMIAGHTKFAPDRFFGLFKKLYRRTSVSTLPDIEQVVRNSTTQGQNVPQSTVDCHTSRRHVTWYSWGEHLSIFFRISLVFQNIIISGSTLQNLVLYLRRSIRALKR